MRKTVVCFVLAMAAGLGAAQGVGGGGSGGGTGSWWGGQVINGGSTLWHMEAFPDGRDLFTCWGINSQNADYSYLVVRDWATNAWTSDGVAGPPPTMGLLGYAKNEGQFSHTVTASCSGSVTIRIAWAGYPLDPPPFIDLKLQSSVSYAFKDTGDGTCADGITNVQPTVTPGDGGVAGSISEKKVFRLSLLNGVGEFSYAPSASSHSDGLQSNCGGSAEWINCVQIIRRAYLSSTSHPGGKKKALTGDTGHIIHEDWDGRHDIAYDLAAPVDNLPVLTATGQTFEATVGLLHFGCVDTEAEQNRFYGDFYQALGFQGSVSGLDAGAYRYLGTAGGSQAGGSSVDFGEDLPSGLLGHGWDILPANGQLTKSSSVWSTGDEPITGQWVAMYNSREDPGSTGDSDTLNFTYTWASDGAQSTATVTLHYVPAVVRPAAAGSWDEVHEPINPDIGLGADRYDPFERHAGFVLVPFDGGAWESNQSDGDYAWWSSVIADWCSNDKANAEKVKAASGVVGLIPPLKVVATGVGVFADLYAKFGPFPQHVWVARKTECFHKAYNIKWIYPFPAQYDEAAMNDYDWQDWRRQLYTVSVFPDDFYSADGYTGQTVGYQYDLKGYDERQWFRLPGTGGGPGGGN